MTIQEKIDKILDEKNRRKLENARPVEKNDPTELNLDQMGDKIIGGNEVFGRDPEFKEDVINKAKEAMGSDPDEIYLDQVGDKFIGGNPVVATDPEFRQQVEDDAIRAMNGDAPTRG